MADTNTPQEQNAIENINDSLVSAGERIANNKKVIYVTLCAVAAFALLIGSYFWFYRNPALNNSWEAYNKVEQTALGNDTVRAREYAKVADNYGSFDAGKVAALAAAESFYNIGKYQDAVKYLEKFKSSDAVLEAQSRMLLGDSFVNLDKYNDAISAYNACIRSAEGNPQIAPVALWKLANVYDAQKNWQKALDCYTQIKNEFPQFQLGNGMSVDAYIARENARLGK